MALAGILSLLILFLTGAALLTLGLRGRLINSNPHCRKCRFDLSGLDIHTDSAKCPECDANLSAPMAVRTTVRRHRRRLIVAGVAMSLIVAIGGVAWGWPAARSYDWRAIQPEWALEYEAVHHDEPIGAVKELSRRAESRSLSRERHSRLAVWAADEYEDISRFVAGHWGDIIAHAWTRGLLTEETLHVYRRNAITFDFTILEDPSESGPVHLLVESRTYWSGTTQTLPSAHVEVVGVRIGEILLKRSRRLHQFEHSAEHFWALYEDPWEESLNPQRMQGDYATYSGRRSPVRLVAEEALPLGEHELVIDLAWTVNIGGPPPHPAFERDPNLTAFVQEERRVLPVHIISEEEARPTAITDESIESELLGCIEIRRLSTERRQGIELVNLSVRGQDIPVAICGDVTLVSGDQRWSMTDPLVMNRSRRFGSSRGILEDFDAEFVDIIITPNPEHVHLIDGLRTYWGREIVFRNVEVQR